MARALEKKPLSFSFSAPLASLMSARSSASAFVPAERIRAFSIQNAFKTFEFRSFAWILTRLDLVFAVDDPLHKSKVFVAAAGNEPFRLPASHNLGSTLAAAHAA